MSKLIIIGAGQAASSCAYKLRALGYDGSITLIGSEAHPPYQRPPLSKKYLLGDLPLERLYLRPETLYHENNITLELGAAVEKINLETQEVSP